MQELSHPHREYTEELGATDAVTLDKLQDAIASEYRKWAGKDTVLALIYMHAYSAIKNIEEYRNEISYLLEQNPTIQLADAVGRIHATAQTFIMATSEGFPNKQYTLHEWQGFYRRMAAGDERAPEASEQFFINLRSRTNTSIAERYIPVALLAGICYGEKIDMVDVGPGVAAGANLLALAGAGELPMPELAVVRSLSRWPKRQGRAVPEGYIDIPAREQVARLLGRASLIGEIFCVDLRPPKDEGTIEYAKGALRPNEMTPEFMDRFNTLAYANPPNVHTYREHLDISDTRQMEMFAAREYQKRHPKIAVLVHSAYGMSDDEFAAAVDNIKNIHFGGTGNEIIAVADYVKVDENDNNKLHFLPMEEWNKTPGNCRMYVWQAACPELGWQEFVRLFDGRGGIVKLGSGRLAVEGELLPVRKALARAAERI